MMKTLLSDIPEYYHSDVTRQKNIAKQIDQVVKDIAGKVVGRVPSEPLSHISKVN